MQSPSPHLHLYTHYHPIHLCINNQFHCRISVYLFICTAIQGVGTQRCRLDISSNVRIHLPGLSLAAASSLQTVSRMSVSYAYPSRGASQMQALRRPSGESTLRGTSCRVQHVRCKGQSQIFLLILETEVASSLCCMPTILRPVLPEHIING